MTRARVEKRHVARSLSTLTLLLVSSLALPQAALEDDSRPTNSTRVISRFANAGSFWQQTEIARQLIAMGDASVIPAIEPHLATNDRRRRCNAAFVLAGLGDERGVAILISELEDTEPGSRVVEAPDTGPGQVVADRYLAALLLGELRERRAVPALIAATRDESINYRAASSLGEIGDASALPALREMAAIAPEQRVFAGYGIAALRASDGFDILEDVAVSDRQWTKRRHAVELAGKTLDRRAIPMLLRALRDDPHPNVRVSAVRSLARIGDRAVLPALRAALGDGAATEVNVPTTVAEEAAKAIAAMESRGQ